MSRWKIENPTKNTAAMRVWKNTPAGKLYAKRHAEYAREWRKRNRERFHENQLRCYQKVRLEMLVHYGGDPPICACCGESHIVFLSIDHKHGNGSEHRRQIQRENRGVKIGGNSLAYWLKKNGWPEGFQVLCYNCNFAKRTGAECPHKTGKTSIVQTKPRMPFNRGPERDAWLVSPEGLEYRERQAVAKRGKKKAIPCQT